MIIIMIIMIIIMIMRMIMMDKNYLKVGKTEQINMLIDT